ncbi:MAG TPA: MlaD family protein [Gemmatimonadaceae bacterium]|nr:MlaD family protein [Gemmatimonadaceae bacterium]
MRQSSFLTWDQLKVGAVILVALVILGAAIIKLGDAGNLFAKRFTLVSFMSNTSGLRIGSGVTVAGQLAGSIKEIEFLPPDADSTRNLRIIIEVDESLGPQLRLDSRARVKTVGLLGDKAFDISPGTPRFRPLREGDTLLILPSTDYEAVVAQASGVMEEVTGLTRDLKVMTGSIARGEGTLGQLVTNRALYDQLNSTLSSTNSLMARLENPRGTIGRLLNDPSLYNSLTTTVASADRLVSQIAAGEGSIGKLLQSDSLYLQLVSIVGRADSLVGTMANGTGTVQKLFTDEELYNQLLNTVKSLNSVLIDVRRDPRRYTPGMIKVF